MEFFSFQNPAVQSALLPLVVALLAGPAFAALRKEWSGLAVGLGFVAGYIAALGWPAFPPVSSTQKIPYLVVAAGILIAAVPRGWPVRLTGCGLWSLAALGWVAWPRIGSEVTYVAAVGVVLAAALMALSLWRDQQDVLVALLVGALGMIPVAYFGSSASIAQAAGGLAAATGGLLLWNWPSQRFPNGAAAVFVGLGSLALLGQQAALYTQASGAALLVLASGFLISWLPRGLPPRGRGLRAVALAGYCLAPAALAGFLSWSRETSSLY